MNTLRIPNVRMMWFAAAGLLSGAGCGATDATVPPLAIEMSATRFTRDSTTLSAVIPFEVRSHDSVPLYVPGCGAHPVLGLQQLTAAGWQDVSAVLGCIGSSAPIPLMPGAVLTDSRGCNRVGTLRLTVAYGGDQSQPLNMTAAGPTFIVQ